MVMLCSRQLGPIVMMRMVFNHQSLFCLSIQSALVLSLGIKVVVLVARFFLLDFSKHDAIF